MALNSKRVRLIAILVLCALMAIIALVWFLIAPALIENHVNDLLTQAEKKMGRHVEISDIALTGIKSAKIQRIQISDQHAPERTGIALDDVEITLTDLPLGSQFAIQSIQIGDLDIHIRMTNGVSNFDDFVQKLTTRKPEDTDETKTPPAWKRFITPLPAITVERIAVSMPTTRINDNLEIGAVSAANMAYIPSELNPGFYDVQGQISILLDESGIRSTYNTEISGNIKNSKEGVISITQPISDNGMVPALMRHDKGILSFKNISLVLPTTFEMAGFHVSENDHTLVHIENTRARLMTLPPKKVSGVYLKEFELTKPQIHDYIRDDGSALYHLTLSLIENFAKGWESSVKAAVKDKAKEMATEAAKAAIAAGIQAAAAGSENIAGDMAKGAVDSVIQPDKPQKDFKDYFFSQRMFITDGQINIEDQRVISLANTQIDHIQLEVGYRSIRKAVDYLISWQFQSPIITQIDLNGVYDMGSEQVKGGLTVHHMHSADSMHKTQAGITAKNAETGEETNVLFKLLPTFNFDNTTFDANFQYDVNLKSKDVKLATDFTLKDLLWSHELISPEPIALNGSTAFDIHANLTQNQFKFENIQLKTNGTNLTLAMSLDKAQRKTRARTNTLSKIVDDWKFGFSIQVPQQPMQQLFDAIPHALRTDLDGLTWQGMLGFEFEATGFLGALSETRHQFILTTSEDFGVLTWPVNRDLMTLNHGLTHTIIDPNALLPHEIVIPPSIYPVTILNLPVYVPGITAEDIRQQYPHWVLFDDLNPWLVQLITTTEDGSFFTHAGFSPLQIKAALEKNVTRQTFSRGASTISMQLIKNLFFGRTKTISRKAQEVIYTWLMESIVQIPKQRIMELYFNIIEFGPEIYGIEEAAKYYFGKRSQDLSLKECAFLMAIIPNPRKGAIYRLQPTLERGIQKTMNFYIQEMYRRKCDPEVIAKTREKYARMNKPVPFEPCCPPQDSLQLMIDNGLLTFYVPNPKDTLVYAYQPELYTPDGSPLFERRETTCGYRGGALDGELSDTDMMEPATSIFEPFVPNKTVN